MEACLQLDNHVGLRDLEHRVVLCVCALCLTSFTHHAWCVVLLCDVAGPTVLFFQENAGSILS